MGLYYIKEFGDAIVSKLRNAVTNSEIVITGLTTGHIDWARAIYTEPVYVMDPTTDLPRIKVRFNNVKSDLGTQIGLRALNCMYEYSIFYYKKQVVGQEHQQLLLQDIELIAKVFSNDPNAWRPSDFVAVGGGDNYQQIQTVMPTAIVQYPELHHNIDYAGIRISTAEIRIAINSWSYPITG